jgi:hypothetical protein
MTCRVGLFVSTTVLSALTLASCAAIIHGTGQEVGISSTPTGAAVWIDNAEKGDTPLVTKLSRKDNHVVKIQLADKKGDGVYVVAVLKPQSDWVKVAQLSR